MNENSASLTVDLSSSAREPSHIALRKGLLKRGVAEETIQGLQESLKRSPKRAYLHSELAMLLASTGQLKLALKEAGQAAALEPDDDHIRWVKSQVWMYAKKYKRALKEMEQLPERVPGNYLVTLSMAACHLQLRHFTQALEQARLVLQINNSNEGALRILVLAHYELGRKDEARQYLLQYIQLTPKPWFSEWYIPLNLLLHGEEGVAPRQALEMLQLDPSDARARRSLVWAQSMNHWFLKPDWAFRRWLWRLPNWCVHLLLPGAMLGVVATYFLLSATLSPRVADNVTILLVLSLVGYVFYLLVAHATLGSWEARGPFVRATKTNPESY